MSLGFGSRIGLLSGVIGLMLFCAGAAAPAKYDREVAKAAFRRPLEIPFPKNNAYTADRARLGKTLFFDPRLSGSNAIACASCHNPGFSWGDGLPRGVGQGSKSLPRRTPTILNAAFADLLFWDGRADSLEAQALGPIGSPGEMNQPLDQLAEKVRSISGYETMFAAAYPGEGITTQTIAKAIATFERTVVCGPAPFDDWIAGDESAISESAKRGFDLFNTKASCVKCHTGWNFTDNGFHDIGLPDEDIGRARQLPGIDVLQHAFKTPTLRDVAHRGPYMHNGSERRLEDVVRYYNEGGEAHRPSLAAEVQPLQLDAREMDDLCNFLRTLTGRYQAVEIPTLPNR